jgi:hypothetical protein
MRKALATKFGYGLSSESHSSREHRYEVHFSIGLVATLVGVIAYKIWLASRLNVNWDEFHFLSYVYERNRGELELLLLTAYTHMFAWLPGMGGNELDQIVVARYVMLALLCLTTWLLWRLCRVWLKPLPALLSCLAYLMFAPVMLHGGSFRFDSLLAPLIVGAILLLVGLPRGDATREYLAGALLGAAFAISLKVALFAPLFFFLLCFRDYPELSLARIAGAMARVVVCAVLMAAIILYFHHFSVSKEAAEAAVGFAGGAAQQSLIELPWFPRVGFLRAYLQWQPLAWLLIAIGLCVALYRRQLAVATLVLSLLPIAFYRNAFPYFYVVMLAPASVLVGCAIQEITAYRQPLRSLPAVPALHFLIWLGLVYQGMSFAVRLRHDEQLHQRMLLQGIHDVFREPVNYVDRCGMVSSFRNVNFFMSTWGLQKYRQNGTPFMPAAISTRQPAFVLVNTVSLNPELGMQGGLLQEDISLISRFYPTYWGPLRVAGARTALEGARAVRMDVPFPALYRIETSASSLLVDGTRTAPGEDVAIDTKGIVVQLPNEETNADASHVVQLVLATAGPPPSDRLPMIPIFSGL